MNIYFRLSSEIQICNSLAYVYCKLFWTVCERFFVKDAKLCNDASSVSILLRSTKNMTKMLSLRSNVLLGITDLETQFAKFNGLGSGASGRMWFRRNIHRTISPKCLTICQESTRTDWCQKWGMNSEQHLWGRASAMVRLEFERAPPSEKLAWPGSEHPPNQQAWK